MQAPVGRARRHLNFIGGKWVEPATGEYKPNTNPADTREVLGEWPRSGRDDARMAIEAARAAFPAWSRTPAPTRGRVLARAVEIVRRRLEDFARVMTLEEGKPLGEARGEIVKGLNLLEFYAGEGFRVHGKTLPSEMPSTFTYTVRAPLGVVALITPWNFPWAIPCWKVAPAIVAGNCAVLKPASNTPWTAHLLAEVLHEAGLPPGVLNVVTGPGGAVGNELVENPVVKAVSFTGSNEVGLALYQKAAARGIKVTAEMGGKNAVIVMPDADLDVAVEGVVQGGFGSTGQRCTATSRVVLHKKIAAEFTEKLLARAKKLVVGNGLREGVNMGPAVDEGQMKTDLDYVKIAREEGGEVILGGERLMGPEHEHGWFVSPTIVRGVKPHHRLAQEEVFGPVLALMEAESFEEALAIHNDVAYGLTGSIYTRDAGLVMRYVDGAEVGMVHINQPTIGGEAQLPFGGIKATGVGEKEMAEEGLNFFTHIKTVFYDYTGTKRETNIY